ncbi:MAG: M56 family metallopeptidase, partial [Luteibacter jiangsuensis]
MLAWMVYAVLVAAALGGAALLAEQGAKQRRLPARGVWIAAIVASIILPVAMATISIPRSWVSSGASATAKDAAEPLLLGDATSIPLTAKAIDWSGATSYASSPRIDTMLTDIWLASSCTLLLFLGVTTMVFHRRKRRWTPGIVCGVPVLVSDDVGPAVVGLVRSRVVIPG